MATLDPNQQNQNLLENILDALCKATKRDITIFYPTRKSGVIPYLKNEIKTTLDEINHVT